MCVPHPPLIIPEIGKGEEKTISNTIQSNESIMKYVSTLPIETVIVISPHAIAYSDYIHISPGIHASGDFSQFHAGYGALWSGVYFVPTAERISETTVIKYI